VAATIDATLQGASANSYVTLAEADAYFETVPSDTHWHNKNDDKKNRALISATRWLDGLTYYGTRCTTTQALKWPRKDYKVDGVEIKCTFIPDEIKVAAFELARALANNTDAVVGSKGTDGVPEEVKLGDLEVKYNTKTQTGSMVNNIFDVFPWVASYLGPYCRMGGSNYSVRVERG
tara:strand:- start:205 stop:735 length:531 start_codon:yes stop_codon:yes gene_type:complete